MVVRIWLEVQKKGAAFLKFLLIVPVQNKHKQESLLGAPGLTTRNKKLIETPGIATRSKDATRGSWLPWSPFSFVPGLVRNFNFHDVFQWHFREMASATVC